MAFWIFMMIMVLLIPICMIIIGRVFINKPPKQINAFYGYRTSKSLKNKETWEFAHRYYGKILRVLGFILLLLSYVPMIYFYGYNAKTVGTVGGILVALQIVAMFCSIIPVERELKKNFDEYRANREIPVCRSSY